MNDDAPLATLQQRQLHDRRAAALVNNKGRDPRATPVSFTRNVSSPESCEFYGVADAISGCRVPRSCQDCLAMPGCGIALGGQCRIATGPFDATDSFDFHNTTFNNDSRVSLSSKFYFNADAATYCAASDLVCVQCRAEFRQLDHDGVSVNTQFCKGDSGCVCIAICEVATERATRVLDNACGQPIHFTKPLPKPQRDGDSVVTRGDPRVPVIKRNRTSNVPEMCAHTSELDVRGCRRPRSCQSCLERPGCVLWNAKCEETEDWNWIRDFRSTKFINSSERSLSADKYFPSSNTTYCSALDARCAACRRRWEVGDDSSSWTALTNSSTFCVGQDGCVCIEACESELWVAGVFDSECLQLDKLSDALNGGSSAAIFLAVSIVLWCFYQCCSRGLTPRHRQLEQDSQVYLWRHMLDAVPGLGRLDLFGWRAHQDRLRQQEQRLLQGLPASNTVSHPVDFGHLDPSAPHFDPDDASAPTAQDPKALASAPVYRGSFHGSDHTGDESSSSRDHNVSSSPSAPDFDHEEVEWGSDAEANPRERGRLGITLRRSRQAE